jgi:hypothetical protein
MVLNAVDLRRNTEVGRFKHGWDQGYVIPKTAVIGLAGKLAVI